MRAIGLAIAKTQACQIVRHEKTTTGFLQGWFAVHGLSVKCWVAKRCNPTCAAKLFSLNQEVAIANLGWLKIASFERIHREICMKIGCHQLQS
jgi:hypothetical protein